MTPRTQAALIRIAVKAMDRYLATGTGFWEAQQALRALERNSVSPTHEDLVRAREEMEKC